MLSPISYACAFIYCDSNPQRGLAIHSGEWESNIKKNIKKKKKKKKKTPLKAANWWDGWLHILYMVIN